MLLEVLPAIVSLVAAHADMMFGRFVFGDLFIGLEVRQVAELT
jgi:hypothetical protein